MDIMKNNKPVSGKLQGRFITAAKNSTITNAPARVYKAGSEKSLSQVSNFRKNSVTDKYRAPAFSSSQESLSGTITSVRRKVSAPTKPPLPVNLKPRSDSTPIRSVNKENIQTTKPWSVGRKTTFKGSHISNMRRAVSKESVDLSANKDREKENVGKLNTGRNQNKSSNNCMTIIQLEKDKVMMEQQISELVRNAECKKAEIATLKMEINKLKDLQSDDAVEQLRQELEASQVENQALKERLVQLGAPLEMTALSDNQKEQLLLQRSLPDSLNLGGSQSNLSEAPKSLDVDVGEASGVTLPPAERPLSDWDKGSSSSMSEMSVACLQDRIMQMEETHHSTNEELQATLQELTDLQDQLTDLQLENERLTDEKAVLLESLCSQTEKLEECRSQITQLKQLLFQQHEQDGEKKPLTPSERESHLVELLKKAQEAHDVLLMKQEELSTAVQVAKEDSVGHQTDLILLRDRVRLLESTVESINADKRLLESQYNESQEQLSANQIEISQLKLQLENEQQKVQEIRKEREAGATSELNALLQETRKDKEKVEERAMRLQEQLALSQREVAKYRDQLNQMQEENMVAKNNAKKQVSDLEYRIEQLESEKEQVHQQMALLDSALQQAELKCQRHLEDKRELKANVGELQKALSESASLLRESQKEIEELKKKHSSEVDEWNKFQSDLLTTVRVANDFKTEAQQDVDRLIMENKQLKEKTTSLEVEIENLKSKPEVLSPALPRANLTFPGSEVSVLTTVEKDLTTATRRPLNTNKRNDRGANQLSVRSLIESIENATKHAKGPGSSCSSSTSSISSVTSDTRSANTLLLSNNNDIFIKPSLRHVTSESTSILRDAKSNSTIGRLSRNTSIDGVSYSLANSTTVPSEPVNAPAGKSETDSIKPLPPHPVSILATKLEPMRRNSYGDVSEKKDPLSSLIRGGGSKRNALLKWCQNKTMGYKGIDITNFSSSWNDGLAFCALMNSYLPDLVPYHELDSKDKRRNFTLAFQAAESVGIPTTLNINDLISQERPDWQSIMAYVTSIYKHFET